jgi:phospholipid/cholesterol/gamma-HCH transport system substrate-binding protein
MSRNVIETVMGGVVLAVAVLFLVFAYSSTGLRSVDGYEVVARFDRIDGLQTGGDVRISGVKVGTILSQSLDPQTYLAEIRMSIDPSIQLPTDTVAVVASESLLGGRFLALEPGGAEEMIPPGGTIEYTQSTPGLEQLLGQVIYSLQSGGREGGS